MKLALGSLVAVALVSTLAACAADAAPEDASPDDVSEDELKSAKDVSADYVGRYAPPANAAPSAASKLLLKTNRTYALTTSSGTEEGTFKVTQSGTSITLRLAPAQGSARNYRASMGTGLRPILTLARYSTTWILERELVSCTLVSCNAGYGCAVEEYEGVPRPVCNPVEPTWKLPFIGHDLWGATLANVVPSSSAYFGRKSITCHVRPSQNTIACGLASWSLSVSAQIQPDGTFAVAYGTATTNGGELRGRIADGNITLERFRTTTCFQTSSSWCEKQETDGQNLPATAKAVQTCRTPDQTFQSGGWAAGYYLDCSQCNGRCEGGR